MTNIALGPAGVRMMMFTVPSAAQRDVMTITGALCRSQLLKVPQIISELKVCVFSGFLLQFLSQFSDFHH